jgi:hypothetical protein
VSLDWHYLAFCPMNQIIKELVINGESYIRKADVGVAAFAKNEDGLSCVIVSCGASGGGIHFGFLKKKEGEEVTLVNARRVQYWNGAASISEMAVRGVSKPAECRFAPIVPEITLLKVVEIIPISAKAQDNLFGVPVWTK